MPCYELVGLYDCPWMAKAEKLLEQVQFQFPIVEYHKSMKDHIQWKDFIQKMKHIRGWTIKRSPVIWEVLVSAKSKSNYIGDIDDFCEYVNAFYGILCENDSTAALLEQVAINKALFGKGFQGLDRGNKTVCNLAIVNGPMRMVECVLAQLLSPISIVPHTVLFNIKIYTDHLTQRQLDGLCMEAVDMSSASLFKLSIATTISEVMYDSHLVLLLEDFTKRVEEEVRDWLNRLEWTSFKYAETMNQMCGNDCRLIIGGDGPQCFVAEIFRKTLSSRKVQPGHLIAVGQHVVNRAKAVISRKTKVPSGCISRVHAWGWPGLVGAYVEVKDAVVRDADCSIQGPSPCEIPLGELGLNPEWLFTKFSEEYLISQNERIQKTRHFHSSDLCMAEAVIATLHIWLMSQVSSAQKPKICCRPLIVSAASGEPATTGTSNENSDHNSQTIKTADIEWENLELVLPVISVGIPCSKKSSFPRGTFMVQPAVCYYGKWVPAGKVSEKTHERIKRQVLKLWQQKQDLIFGDTSIAGLFPDYDAMMMMVNGRANEDGGEDGEQQGEY